MVMESTAQPEYRSPIARLGTFLRDFLPEQNLQVLFPLASFLLLLGASHFWYRIQLPGVFEVLQQRNSQVDPQAFQQFNHSYRAWVQLEEQIALALTRLAFFASLILWCLSVRKVVSKFVAWVFLPAAFALAAFQLFLMATAHQRNAFLDAFTSATQVPVPSARPWFPSVGDGIHLTAGGLIVLAVALVLVRQQTISLPLRFRHSTEVRSAGSLETSTDERNILVFLIVMIVCSSVVSLFFFLPNLLASKLISWDSRSFAIFQWAPALVNAAAAACLAFVLFGKEKWQTANRLLRVQPFRNYALAVGIPLGVVLIPRFLLGVVFSSSRWPSGEPDVFIPHPLPSVLVVYLIAFFEEFALREYLQSRLEKHLSLKRSIFVTGILWSLLPLGFGMTHSLVEAKAYFRIPGLSYLALLVGLLVYSVPLGWLYARTRSVIAVALMHGTIALFHVGMGYEIHINQPEFYWMEMALWIFIGWYLFKKYPLESTESSREPEVAPA